MKKEVAQRLVQFRSINVVESVFRSRKEARVALLKIKERLI